MIVDIASQNLNIIKEEHFLKKLIKHGHKLIRWAYMYIKVKYYLVNF